jgi:hypothetical protein
MQCYFLLEIPLQIFKRLKIGLIHNRLQEVGTVIIGGFTVLRLDFERHDLTSVTGPYFETRDPTAVRF